MNKNIMPILLVAAFFGGWPAHAQAPWSDLERHQRSITADTFSRLLEEVYAPDGGMIPFLRFGDERVRIYSDASQTGAPLFELIFASTNQPPVTFTASGDERAPLTGLKIAVDPGHIGGAWSRMEERFFLVDRQKDWPVQEAALNLFVTRLIRDRLAKAGAEVVLVKDDFEPLTPVRPDELMLKENQLQPPDARFAHLPDLFVESSRRDAQRKQVERHFYRSEEIDARADRINHVIKPDITICIHFNATGWGDEKTLYEENGLAFFVHGNYQADELESDEQKYFLVSKLLEQSHEVELGVTAAIADAFVSATGLFPAYSAEGGVMFPLGTNHYIYARNLSANRQYRGPVIYLEPYFMNNRTVYARIQAGDYEGEKEIDGKMYQSIFREYADAVAAGVEKYFKKQHSTSNVQTGPGALRPP